MRPESPITVVALKDIAREVAGLRPAPALASALAWLGSDIRGILMSRIAERIGTRSTVIFVSLMIGLGLSISTFGPPAASGGIGRTEFHHPTPRRRGGSIVALRQLRTASCRAYPSIHGEELFLPPLEQEVSTIIVLMA